MLVHIDKPPTASLVGFIGYRPWLTCPTHNTGVFVFLDAMFENHPVEVACTLVGLPDAIDVNQHD
jgi:hypothetical protein